MRPKTSGTHLDAIGTGLAHAGHQSMVNKDFMRPAPYTYAEFLKWRETDQNSFYATRATHLR